MGSFPINSCPKYGVKIEQTLQCYGKRTLNGGFSHKTECKIKLAFQISVVLSRERSINFKPPS